MTLRVLGHTHTYPPGGAAGGPLTMHALLREGRKRRGWSVSVLLDAAPNQSYVWNGMRVNGTRSVPAMRKQYADNDVVVTHLGATKRAIDLAAKSRPLVHLVHNHRQLYMHGVEPLPNNLVLFNSIWMSKNTVWGGASAVLHPIVDVEKVRVKPEGQAVVLVSRSVNKGAEMFYKLAEANPEFQFIAVRGAYGQQTNAPILPNLKEMDNVEDVRRVYQQARVVLMPSFYESWGRVAIEAAVSGIPTIGSGTHGLVESRVATGLFDPGDFEAWNASLRLLMTDEAEWQVASTHASERVEQVLKLIDMETERALDLIEALV